MLSRFKTRMFIVVILEILVSIVSGFIIGPAASALAVGMLIINSVATEIHLSISEKN